MCTRVIFNVVNFSKTKSLYRDGMSPVVKSTSRPKCASHCELCLLSWGPGIVRCRGPQGTAGLG
ncbi:Cytosolic carboxypeptidase 6 [Liparis tanakae]|uniref:Cytosolic carboxypeptidase 6 n=1 Tax=Liparis tanakae TaxID=230148 RepID=A0A4Z2IBK9_9TELE|nr:Cytosolic carboxypeptidase 6 [Liparis tanakae]